MWYFIPCSGWLKYVGSTIHRERRLNHAPEKSRILYFFQVFWEQTCLLFAEGGGMAKKTLNFAIWRYLVFFQKSKMSPLIKWSISVFLNFPPLPFSSKNGAWRQKEAGVPGAGLCVVLWVSLEVGVSFISIVMGHPVICCQSPPVSSWCFLLTQSGTNGFLTHFHLLSSEILSFSTAGLLLPFLSFPTLPPLPPGIAFLSVLSPWTSLIWAVPVPSSWCTKPYRSVLPAAGTTGKNQLPDEKTYFKILLLIYHKHLN